MKELPTFPEKTDRQKYSRDMVTLMEARDLYGVEALSVREAAHVLRVQPRAIRRLIESGRLTAMRIGDGITVPFKPWFIPELSLLAYVGSEIRRVVDERARKWGIKRDGRKWVSVNGD